MFAPDSQLGIVFSLQDHLARPSVSYATTSFPLSCCLLADEVHAAKPRK
jgi:hypothetical protein